MSKLESTEEHQKSMIKDQCPRCLMKKFQDIKVMILIPLLLGLVEQNYSIPIFIQIEDFTKEKQEIDYNQWSINIRNTYFYQNKRFYKIKARNLLESIKHKYQVKWYTWVEKKQSYLLYSHPCLPPSLFAFITRPRHSWTFHLSFQLLNLQSTLAISY